MPSVWSAENSTMLQYNPTWNIGHSQWSIKQVNPWSKSSTKGKKRPSLLRKSHPWSSIKWRKPQKHILARYAYRIFTLQINLNFLFLKILSWNLKMGVLSLSGQTVYTKWQGFFYPNLEKVYVSNLIKYVVLSLCRQLTMPSSQSQLISMIPSDRLPRTLVLSLV